MIVGAYGFNATDHFSINTAESIGGAVWVAVCQTPDCQWQGQSVTEKAAVLIGWSHLHAAHPKQATRITKTAPHNPEGKQL